MRIFTTALVVFLIGSASSARADENVIHKKDRGEVTLALKAGGMVARGFSRLDGSYVVAAEVGYVLPVLRHHLALAVDAAFSAPHASGSSTDPRLTDNSGSYTWRLEQRELTVGLTLFYRHPIRRVTPYIGIGPRVFFLESKVKGTVGTTNVAESSEVSTKVGVGIPLGVGFRLGPGDLFIEAQLAISRLEHRTTGDSNTGSLALLAGYRVFL